jgi:hypothetical protein
MNERHPDLGDPELSSIYKEFFSEKFREEERKKMKEDQDDLSGCISPSGMLMASKLAKHLFPVEKMPGGALPIYDRDLEIVDIAVNSAKDGWIQTYTGKKFFPAHPRLEDIDIDDIAHALSLQCRFTGQCSHFYSIAQHSVLVSYLCDERDRLHGLLHDSSEAYISDISSPVKALPELAGYKKIEKCIQQTIYRKFQLDEIEPMSVKNADLMMLGIEATTLLAPLQEGWSFPIKFPPLKVIPLLPEEAEKLFRERFIELTA